jgi:adenine-specific DNA-methyltransferase
MASPARLSESENLFAQLVRFEMVTEPESACTFEQGLNIPRRTGVDIAECAAPSLFPDWPEPKAILAADYVGLCARTCVPLSGLVTTGATKLTTAETIDAIKAARNEARLLAEKASSRRLAFARGFVATAISHYCRGEQKGTYGLVAHPHARIIGELARDLDDDLAAYLLGTIYTVMLPPEDRASRGVFYTPPGASDRLMAMAEATGIDWHSVRVADVACGGGAFLAPIARRILRSRQWRSSVEAAQHLQTHLRGFEIDPFSAWMSQVFLSVAFCSVFPTSRCNLAGCVEVGDSLNKPLEEFGSYDLVIGNPPYGRVTLDKKRRSFFARSLYGHANLYGLFTDLALRLLKPEGRVAYVTPASFLGGQYFERLRALIGAEAPPASLDFLTSRDGVFADVLQETVLVTFQRGEARPFPVSFTNLMETGPATVRHAGMGVLPARRGEPWLLPRAPEHCALIASAKSLPHRLRDYGYAVSTGPLVWNRHKSKLGHVRTTGAVPIIWAEAVAPDGSGRFTLKAEARNHAPWYQSEGDEDMNVIGGPCVLVQRTTSKEQKRRVIAAALPEPVLKKFRRVSVENHLNMVRQIPGIEPLLDPAGMSALLNSESIDALFRCVNGSTAVSAYELEALPLPNPRDIQPLCELVRRHASRSEIDQFISGLYAHVRIGAAA